MAANEQTARRCFALQVVTRREARFLRAASHALERMPGVRLFWPRHSLKVRPAGSWREVLQPVFQPSPIRDEGTSLV